MNLISLINLSLSFLKELFVTDKDRICLGNYTYIDFYKEPLEIYTIFGDHYSEIANIRFNDFIKIINVFLDSNLGYYKYIVIRDISSNNKNNTIIFSLRVSGDGKVQAIFERARDGAQYKANNNYEEIKKLIYGVCERFNFKMTETVMFRRP